MEQDICDVDVNTWQKVEKTATLAGFREGISDGRETNFQSGFDNGYKTGFQSGFTLGFYKGSINFQKEKQNTNPMLEKTMTGNCQLCSIQNIDNEEMSQLEKIQKRNYENILTKLKTDCPHIVMDGITK